MGDLTHDELRIALKEIPNYGAYSDMPRWPLFDSVCLIIDEWPDKEARKYWGQSIEDRFKGVYMPMLSDILAGRLTAEWVEVDKDYWLTREDVIGWVKANHLPVGSAFLSIQKSGRDLQKEESKERWSGLQKDADGIARRCIEEGKPIPTKDEIARELLKLPRWRGTDSETLIRNFYSPKSRKSLED